MWPLEKNAPPLGSHVFQPTTNLLTKFHEDRTVNVASRVLTRFYYSHIRKNAPPLGSHVFQANIIIFEPIQDIIKTNLLTTFHKDWTINVASRVLTRKNVPPMVAITNLLTKFHDDRKINVTSRVLTRKNAPPPWWPNRTINVASRGKNAPPLSSHVFQVNVTIFELIQDINKTNLLTIFHEDWTLNVASRVLTRKNTPPHGGHVFKETKTIFELIQDIIGTNLLTKIHEDRKINVASRVLTRKNVPPPGGHVVQPTGIIFGLVQYIIKMNLLTKFHEDWTINVASRVHIKKSAPSLGSHVFQAKFHEDRKINVASRVLTRKNAPPPGGHAFQPNGIIFKLVQDIIGMNLLTKCHEDQTINVASREKNAPPLGSHVFQANVPIFKLIQDIIETNLLTKFHEDWTINVASSELTRQMLTPHNGRRTTDDGRRTKGDHKSSPRARCAQFPAAIHERRNILIPCLVKARSESERTSLVYNILHIDDTTFTAQHPNNRAPRPSIKMQRCASVMDGRKDGQGKPNIPPPSAGDKNMNVARCVVVVVFHICRKYLLQTQFELVRTRAPQNMQASINIFDDEVP
ncbi:hypothetical protein DPMN_164342 [Dreissena polymorpha]|uniref:Uncharacterized protein n=1 Tax=Dreissena polymorpha TaxID=45954 RepID=A0A9D4EXN6_DREPO|nr:hypothetical protein DPMN_164342 [Dreissena polymorpha]